MAGVAIEQEKMDFLAEMNPYNIEGRYPEMWAVAPTREEADAPKQRTGEIFEWLKNQL